MTCRLATLATSGRLATTFSHIRINHTYARNKPDRKHPLWLSFPYIGTTPWKGITGYIEYVYLFLVYIVTRLWKGISSLVKSRVALLDFRSLYSISLGNA